jgi:hypothetical protein
MSIEELLAKTFPICGVKNGAYVFIGTGSYIDEYGGFVPAKHVFENKDLDEDSKYVMVMPDQNHREVEHIFLHPERDIALGKPFECVYEATNGPALNDAWVYTDKTQIQGEKIWGSGYADSYYLEKKPDVMRFRLQPYIGEIVDVCKNCPSGFLKGMCYQTNMHIKSGASGGPVINSRGRLIGVMSSSFDTDEGESHVGFITPILYVADIIVESEGEKVRFGDIMYPNKESYW